MKPENEHLEHLSLDLPNPNYILLTANQIEQLISKGILPPKGTQLLIEVPNDALNIPIGWSEIDWFGNPITEFDAFEVQFRIPTSLNPLWFLTTINESTTTTTK